MDSFSISVTLENKTMKLLVIPEDCTNNSIFHLVYDGVELVKISFKEPGQWKVLDGYDLSEKDLEEIARKIEEHY